ncbi:MAG: hypothetical protein R2839_04595 [Thermomicrobiales bacterium]
MELDAATSIALGTSFDLDTPIDLGDYRALQADHGADAPGSGNAWLSQAHLKCAYGVCRRCRRCGPAMTWPK